MTTRRKRVLIRGVVQGVGFRRFAVRTAESVSLVGWVRNCEDGSVLAEIQGNEQALKRFIDWAHRGAPLAEVEEVVVEDIPTDARDTEFLIIS